MSNHSMEKPPPDLEGQNGHASTADAYATTLVPAFPTSSNPASIHARLSHFTWGWYTLSMSTGGLALLLNPTTQPHSFSGLLTIGRVVYVVDLVLFVLITALIIYRFVCFPGTLKASLTHPTESLFASTSLISLASIIACIGRYGVPMCGYWLTKTFLVLFWIYYTITWISAITAYAVLFTNPMLRIQDMTPGWDLPIFPVMLTGTIASVGSGFLKPSDAAPVIVGGLLAQGLGFWVSVLMYASYVRRMIQYGFPSVGSRPAMFIAVGPPSFTALAIIGMASNWPVEHYNLFGGDAEATRVVLKVLSLVVAIFIWSLSFWFFCIGVVSTAMVAKELKFKLNWNAFVFPNVGLTIAVIDIGNGLQSEAVKWVGSIMTILIVALYLFVQAMCIRALWRQELCFEGMDEDVYRVEKKTKKEKEQKKQQEAGIGVSAGEREPGSGSEKDD